MTTQNEGRRDRWLTPRDFANLLSISTRTLRRYVAQGLVAPAHLPGGQPRYRASQADELLQVPDAGPAPVQAASPVDPFAAALSGVLSRRRGA